ncbi:MAG: hypothetical protein LBL91_05600 [Lachnospiraceae bacterium]|jgi:hypothetical protein|nr:hypothetical protein [Lachnospiraceae bacterium]
MNERQKNMIRKVNMKLYPIYLSIGHNLLFVQGVKVLFLSQVKSISNADIVFLRDCICDF